MFYVDLKLLQWANSSIFFLGNSAWFVFRPIFFCHEKQGKNFKLESSVDLINQLVGVSFFSRKSFCLRKGPLILHITSNCDSGVPTSFQILLDPVILKCLTTNHKWGFVFFIFLMKSMCLKYLPKLTFNNLFTFQDIWYC